MAIPANDPRWRQISRGLIVSGTSFVLLGATLAFLTSHPANGRLALAAALLAAGIAGVVTGTVLERRRRRS